MQMIRMTRDVVNVSTLPKHTVALPRVTSSLTDLPSLGNGAVLSQTRTTGTSASG